MVKQPVQEKRPEIFSQGQEAQISAVALKLGLDSAFLMQYLRGAGVERTATGGALITPPPMLRTASDAQSRTAEFATDLLGRSARGGGALRVSDEALAAAAAQYVRRTWEMGNRGSLPVQVEEGTERWMRSLAERYNVDAQALIGCYVAYHSLSGAGGDFARAAMDEISGGNGRVVALAMACIRNSRSEERGVGSEYQIAQRDRAEAERDFARGILPSRRRETA